MTGAAGKSRVRGRRPFRLRWRFALLALVAGWIPPQTPAPADAPLAGRSVRQAIAAVEAPALTARVIARGRGFNGRVGIAVRDIDEGWTADFDGETPFPQQSVSKLWVALAALDAVDRGRLALTDTMVVRKRDLSVFHQPLRRFVDADGYRVSVRDLIRGAIAQSDNAANDTLVAQVGGREAVQAILDAHRLKGVRASPSERVMQAQIAGLEWKPEYSFDRAFWINQ